MTLAPIVAASFAIWAARSLRDLVRASGAGHHGLAVPEEEAFVLDDAFDRKRPVVFRGVAASWPVFEDYQPKQLLEKYRTEKVAALVSSNSVFTQETAPTEVLQYAEVMDSIFGDAKDGKKYYSRAAADPRPLAAQLPHRVGRRTQSSVASSVWVGQAGNLTPLHNDPWHGLLIQLYGRKRVRLFDPDEYRNVYGRVPRRASDMYTELPAEDFDPSLDDYPRLRNASSYDVVLEPGDILYIPMFWWHQVESLDPAVSYVARYNPRYAEFARAAFFPQAVRGMLRIAEVVKSRLRPT
ncbi:hypothetical protein GCM10027089_46920 [Nocardia thraciensis]